MTKLTYMDNIILQIALTDLKYKYQGKAGTAYVENDMTRETFWIKQAEKIESLKTKLIEIEKEGWNHGL